MINEIKNNQTKNSIRKNNERQNDKRKIIEIIKRKIISNSFSERKIIMSSLLIGFIITSIIGLHNQRHDMSDRMQAGIAEKVIRLHILANSDNDIDQYLKLQVRDGLLGKYSDDLKKFCNINDSRFFIKENLENIENEVNKIIRENGFDYVARASLEKSVFPTNYYGGLTFPAGLYEALRVEIGEATGQNWWCVMFPPLCFVDVAINRNPVDMRKPDVQEDPHTQQRQDIPERQDTQESPDNPEVGNETRNETRPEINRPLPMGDNETETNSSHMARTSSTNSNRVSRNVAPDRAIRNAPSDLSTRNTPTDQATRSMSPISEETNEILRESLSDEEYEFITRANEKNSNVQIRFKAVELWRTLHAN